MGDAHCNMPPGFRFCPTDEELVANFLHRKAGLIPDLGLLHCDPWDLHGKAMREGDKWYFYSRPTQKRVTGSGQWIAGGVEEPVYSSGGGGKIGLKKHWVFYVGGVKTSWVMQEFTLLDPASRKIKPSCSSKWVVCKVYEEENGGSDGGAELSCLDEVFLSLDDLDDITSPN